MKTIVKQISLILHSWDPIGSTSRDEYDGMALELYKLLNEGKSREQLMDFTAKYLTDTIELTAVDKDDISKYITQIVDAYSSSP
jgi:hypothetical protein